MIKPFKVPTQFKDCTLFKDCLLGGGKEAELEWHSDSKSKSAVFRRQVYAL